VRVAPKPPLRSIILHSTVCPLPRGARYKDLHLGYVTGNLPPDPPTSFATRDPTAGTTEGDFPKEFQTSKSLEGPVPQRVTL